MEPQPNCNLPTSSLKDFSTVLNILYASGQVTGDLLKLPPEKN